MRTLVIGGAGYIGSHFIRVAKRQGHEVVVYDNLSRGHKAALPTDTPLIEANILDAKTLESTLKKQKFDSVFHFAALALVGESVQEPDLYYQNNAEGVRTLINAMRAFSPHSTLVFSSSCAVFGTPMQVPMVETDPKNPVSPYGRSKLIAEWFIEDACRAYGLRAIALRYFNACGAEEDGKIGEDHRPETHLLPNLIKAALTESEVTIFGQDFATRDGTCVRDYIHVLDLAEAHLKAALHLGVQPAGHFDAIHLGSGIGYTNLEVLRAVEAVTKKKLAFSVGPRRAGDPAELYADNRKAKQVLGFECKHSSLENIIRSALGWHKARPKGYLD